MLPFPLRFDGNEWFIIVTMAIGYICVTLLPKKYPNTVSALIVLFCVAVATILDHSIATPPLDMYDINDLNKYELMDVITYFMYSPYALISVYLYDRLQPKGLFFVVYIIGWSALAEFFEWLASVFNVFVYTGWNLMYSFPVYLFSTTVVITFFLYTMSYLSKNNGTPS